VGGKLTPNQDHVFLEIGGAIIKEEQF